MADPTKTLVASAHAAHTARRGGEYGVGVGGVTVDMCEVKARKDRIMRNERDGVESWLEGMSGCTVIRGHARFEGPNVIRVDGRLLTADKVFLNVGGVPWFRRFPDCPTSTTSPTSESWI